MAVRARDLEAILALSDPERVPHWAPALEDVLVELHDSIRRERDQARASSEHARRQREGALRGPIPMVSLDASGVVQCANIGAARLLDVSAQDLVGSRLDDLLEAMVGPLSPVCSRIVKVLGEHALTAEVRALETRSGIRRSVLCLIDTVCREEGEPAEAACALIGLDGLEEPPEAPRTSAVDAAITRLAASVAHDFNDLLTAIFGHARLLRGRLAGDARALREVQEIEHAAERARLLTDQLRAFGRGTASHPEDEQHGTEGHPAWSDDPLEEVRAALPSGRMGGCVCVVDDDSGVRRLVVTVLESGGYSVVDASSGEEALRVFREESGRIDLLLTDINMPTMHGDDLYDALRATHPNLQVVYMSGLVDKAEFRLGKPWACDFLQKPFFPRELLAKVEEALTRADQVSSRPRVLVVDDYADARAMLGRMLRSLGLDAVVAENAEKALETLANTRVDAVICDVVMPGKGGVQACAEMRRRHPKVEVIAMTGHPSASPGLADARKVGAIATLHKPFRVEQLKEALELALHGPLLPEIEGPRRVG